MFADARTAEATDRCWEGFDDRLAAECLVEPPCNGEDEEGEERGRVEGERSHGSMTAEGRLSQKRHRRGVLKGEKSQVQETGEPP